jgi:hypothetical protein
MERLVGQEYIKAVDVAQWNGRGWVLRVFGREEETQA